MAKIEELQEIIGDLMKVDVNTLEESTPLNGILASSIGRARLDAKLRSRLGISNIGVYTVPTFGSLCTLLKVNGARNGAFAPVSGTPQVTASRASPGDIRIGVDIQSVLALPVQADYWDDDFYQQHFTPQEIAYALLQPNPRESFTAAWCAKEALRKADSRWCGVEWKLIEISHDANGKPSLLSEEGPIPCSVSLSHTDGFAVAVVAMATVPEPAQQAIPIAGSAEKLGARENSGGASNASLFLSVAALLIALATAVHSFLK